jgi:hypothetical protein
MCNVQHGFCVLPVIFPVLSGVSGFLICIVLAVFLRRTAREKVLPPRSFSSEFLFPQAVSFTFGIFALYSHRRSLRKARANTAALPVPFQNFLNAQQGRASEEARPCRKMNHKAVCSAGILIT